MLMEKERPFHNLAMFLFPLLNLAQICSNMSTAALEPGAHSPEEPHKDMTALRFSIKHLPIT